MFNEDKHWFYNVLREDVMKIERLATCNWLLAVYTSLMLNHSIKYFLKGMGKKKQISLVVRTYKPAARCQLPATILYKKTE